MWDKIVDLAITNGLWAVMFLGLLIYLLKDSRVRESKYQSTISSLNKSLGVVEKVEENVVEIKQDVLEIRQDVTKIKQKVISSRKKAG